MQAARSGLKLLRAIALCSFSLCAAAAVYMSAAEHYDDALARLQNSAGIFIVFIIVVIGIILALASFVSNLLVGRSSRDDRVLLAMKLKEYIVTHLAMASFLSGERAFGHPGDIFESSLWMLWFGCHLVPFVWLQVSRLRLQNLRRGSDLDVIRAQERSSLLLLAFAAVSSLGLCSFGWAATSSLGFSSLSVLAVLVHDGLLMSCRALSVALSHTFYKRTQLSAHQVQPLCFVVVEQGLEAFIHSLSAFMIVFMCGLRIFTLGFLEMMFLSQAASHVSKTATALRMLWSAVSLELSLNQVLQPVPHAPDDWCAVCFEPLGGASLGDGSAADAAAATAASLGGCVRLPCNHCFHKHCMVAWLRKKAECPTCRASVWPLQTSRVLFHSLPSRAAVDAAAVGVGVAADVSAGAAASSNLPQDPSIVHAFVAPASLGALLQPHVSSATAASSTLSVQLPRVPAVALSSLAADASASAVGPLPLVASSSVFGDSAGDPEILYTDTRMHRAASQHANLSAAAVAAPARVAVAQTGAAAAAAFAAPARATLSVGTSSSEQCVADADCEAEQWTTVSRRRRGPAALR